MTAHSSLPFLVAFDDVEPGADYQLFSASQIDTFLDCRRKWAWDKIARIPRPSTGAASLGDRVHHQLENVLDGGSFDFTEVVNGAKVADIAASGLHLLPAPCAPYEPVDCDVCQATGSGTHPGEDCDACGGTGKIKETPADKRARHARHGMAIESSFRWQSSSTNFVYTGRKDLELDDSGCIPGLAEEYGLEVDAQGRTGVPAVLDHKSTSSLRWAKTSEDLEWDVQANLYAYDLAATRGAPVVDLVWNYYQTKGGKVAKRTHLRVTREQAVHKFRLIQDVARDMATIKRRAPTFDNAPREGVEGPPDMGKEWRERNAAFVEGITPNGAACEKFGGCSYRHVCRLTPAEGAFAFMSNTNNALFDSLRKRAAAQDGVKVADKPAELPPTCAPEDVPAPTEVPAWATNGDPPISLKKNAAPAPAVAPPAINPPEASLPPPTLPPPPVVQASADTAEKTASDDTKTTKRGPGRPRKSAAQKDPLGADAAMHAGTPPAPIAQVDTLSDEAAQADRAVATCDTPVEHRAWKDIRDKVGLTLFVDCMPLGQSCENADTYIAKARETIAATEFTDAKGNPVHYADYRFIPFGQGPGALAIAVEQAVDEAKPTALILSTATPEGCAVLASLSAKASLVVRGLR